MVFRRMAKQQADQSAMRWDSQAIGRENWAITHPNDGDRAIRKSDKYGIDQSQWIRTEHLIRTLW